MAIIPLVLINDLSSSQTTPAYLKHVPDFGPNFPDQGAPVFVFAIGFANGLAFRRQRVRRPLPAALGHFLGRNLAFFDSGALITASQTILGKNLSIYSEIALTYESGFGLIRSFHPGSRRFNNHYDKP
jgi:predicted acyltransferase